MRFNVYTRYYQDGKLIGEMLNKFGGKHEITHIRGDYLLFDREERFIDRDNNGRFVPWTVEVRKVFPDDRVIFYEYELTGRNGKVKRERKHYAHIPTHWSKLIGW